MTSWYRRLRDLPLRTKVTLTVVGAAVAALGISSYFSFRYWEEQALEAAEQQALMAAESSRAAVESALAYGRSDQARRNLQRLVREGAVTRARVYDAAGTVVLSGDASEEGRRAAGIWIPDAREIPSEGMVSVTPDADAVRAYLPLGTPGAAVFEVEFSVAPVEKAMQRGTRLGLGLAAASVLALAVIFLAMARKEVVAPLERIQRLLAGSTGSEPDGGRGELDRMERSIVELMEKEAEAEREAAERRRELAERAGFAEVGELAAEMAHELKRPLANLRTAVDLLEQEYDLDPGGNELLEALEDQLEQLSATMADLFSLARPVELERERIDPADVVETALSDLSSAPEARGVEIRYGSEPGTPRLLGDPRRLQQALLNVVTNALEATAEGGSVTILCRPAGDGGAIMEVTDTGAGIPREELEEVTRPFYSTKPMGTGLGLPLVARIVAAHDGRLEIDSEPGKGTTVRLRFPPSRTTNAADPESEREDGGRPVRSAGP